MAHDVFVSYSSQDRTTAYAMCATLEAKRIRCWIAPRDVLAGMNYAEALMEAIGQSRVMVLVFSSHSNRSQQVINELETAVNRGIPILPFRVEDVPPSGPVEFYIRSRHWLDAWTPPLQRHLDQLAQTVEALLSRAGTAPVVSREPEPPISGPAAQSPVLVALGTAGRALLRHGLAALRMAGRLLRYTAATAARRPLPSALVAAGICAVILVALVVVAMQGGGGNSSDNGQGGAVALVSTTTAVTTNTPKPAATPITTKTPKPAATPSVAGSETPAAEKVPGVTDTEILLGSHFALSQSPAAAAYAPIADGIRAYFDYINSQGGVHGRRIKFLVEDDHFNPADAVEVVRKLVEQDRIFAMVGGLGDAPHAAIYKYLEENGIPDMFISAGLDKWTDPVVKTRFGGNPDYETEGKILGQYIAEHYNGKRLGLLVQNDEFGQDGKAGILKGLEGGDVEIVSEEAYEPSLWDVTAQAQRLKAANPDVIIAYAMAPQAASLVKAAREILHWDVPIVVTGVVVTDIFIQLAGPQNAEGVVSVVFARQVYQTDDPGIQRHIQIMKDFGQGLEASDFTLYGQALGELMVKSLENAGPNLTRENLIEGAEAIRDWCCSTCIAPINLSPVDHRPFETEVYNRVENGKWVTFGEPMSFESTPGKVIGCKGFGEPVYEGQGG